MAQDSCSHPISLGDIHNMPTLWVLALFGIFYKFCFHVQTCCHLGGGYLILFETCKKSPFQKCMVGGGGGGGTVSTTMCDMLKQWRNCVLQICRRIPRYGTEYFVR